MIINILLPNELIIKIGGYCNNNDIMCIQTRDTKRNPEKSHTTPTHKSAREICRRTDDALPTLTHPAHCQRSRKRPEQKSPELRPCARAEREAAALGAHYFLHSCTSCCLKYLRSSSSTSTKLRKYLTENLLLMFLNVGVRLSNLRACKRTQAWARGVALHAGAGRPPIAGWAVVSSPAKEESDRDGLASDGRAWQRWEDGAWCAALVSSEDTCNVQRAIE